MAAFPRQPRTGNPSNNAKVVVSGGKNWIALRNTSGTYVNSFYVSTKNRATIICNTLNNLFDNYPGADLDFITPSYMNNCYVVAWSGVKWFEDKSFSTTTTNHGTTYENLYASCQINNAHYDDNYAYSSRADNFMVLATVTNDDTQAYGIPAWELALKWANAIRSPINGWNCGKDCTKQSVFEENFALTIPQLKTPTQSISQTASNLGCTIYGLGEKLPGFNTGNMDLFHTCDLTIAQSPYRKLGYNKWVKITYNGKSVVARVTDQSSLPENKIDLSAGVAYALGITGALSGGLTISPP